MPDHSDSSLPKSPTGYTYHKGFETLHDEWAERRTPFLFMPEDLPPADIDFEPLKTQMVPQLPDYAGPRPNRSDYYTQRERMRPRFSGQPELHFLFGCLIMMSRRDHFPEEMQHIWNRLWEEEWEFLLDTLSLRWKISAMVTFGEHGATEAERHLGRELFLLTGMMKIQDTERSFSGFDADDVYDLDGRSPQSQRATALGMVPYSIGFGDLDRVIFALIWDKTIACENTPCCILARDILDEINRSQSSVFRRIIHMRREHRARRKARKEAQLAQKGK